MSNIDFDRDAFDRDLDAVRRARGGSRDGPSRVEQDLQRLAAEMDARHAKMIDEVKAVKDAALAEIDQRERDLRTLIDRAIDIINRFPSFMRETAETLEDHSQRLNARESSVLDVRRLDIHEASLESIRSRLADVENVKTSDEDVVQAAVRAALAEFSAAMPRPSPLSMTMVDEDHASKVEPSDAEMGQLWVILADIVTREFWPAIWLEQRGEKPRIVSGWSKQQLERLNEALRERGVLAETTLTRAAIGMGDSYVARTSETGLDAAQACALALAIASSGGDGGGGEEWPADEPADDGEGDWQGDAPEGDPDGLGTELLDGAEEDWSDRDPALLLADQEGSR